MANVKSLTTKKAALTEKLNKLTETTEAKIARLEKAHAEHIADVNAKFEAKVNAARDGIVGARERLEEEIAKLDKELHAEIGALQAQIDAIRGVSASVEVVADSAKEI